MFLTFPSYRWRWSNVLSPNNNNNSWFAEGRSLLVHLLVGIYVRSVSFYYDLLPESDYSTFQQVNSDILCASWTRAFFIWHILHRPWHVLLFIDLGGRGLRCSIQFYKRMIYWIGLVLLDSRVWKIFISPWNFCIENQSHISVDYAMISFYILVDVGWQASSLTVSSFLQISIYDQHDFWNDKFVRIGIWLKRIGEGLVLTCRKT